MKAKIYKLGKTQFAITRPSDGNYLVFQLVREKWTRVGSTNSLDAAELSIFRAVVKDGGMVTI